MENIKEHVVILTKENIKEQYINIDFNNIELYHTNINVYPYKTKIVYRKYINNTDIPYIEKILKKANTVCIDFGEINKAMESFKMKLLEATKIPNEYFND